MRSTPKQLLIKSLAAIKKMNKKTTQKAIQILGYNPLEKQQRESDIENPSLIDKTAKIVSHSRKGSNQADLDKTVNSKGVSKNSSLNTSNACDTSMDVSINSQNSEYDQGLTRVESKYEMINSIYKDMHDIRDK